jgi:hypothetical protein
MSCEFHLQPRAFARPGSASGDPNRFHARPRAMFKGKMGADGKVSADDTSGQYPGAID